MEIFEMVWWNAAADNPEVCMPKIMKYLDENFEGEEKETHCIQIERSLKMGRDEIVKMTKRYLLKAPIVILVLINRKQGLFFYVNYSQFYMNTQIGFQIMWS